MALKREMRCRDVRRDTECHSELCQELPKGNIFLHVRFHPRPDWQCIFRGNTELEPNMGTVGEERNTTQASFMYIDAIASAVAWTGKTVRALIETVNDADGRMSFQDCRASIASRSSILCGESRSEMPSQTRLALRYTDWSDGKPSTNVLATRLTWIPAFKLWCKWVRGCSKVKEASTDSHRIAKVWWLTPTMESGMWRRGL